MSLLINLTKNISNLGWVYWNSININYFICLLFFVFIYISNIHNVVALTNNNFFDSTQLKYTGTINSIYLSSNFKNEINSDMIMQSSYVLGGNWKIEISKDELVFFKVNISMMDLDGNFKHNHILTFIPQKHGIANLPILVQIKKTDTYDNFGENKGEISEITFKVRIKLITDDITEPNDTTIDVTIKNNNILIIKINDNNRMKDHFKQPIFGIVEKIG